MANFVLVDRRRCPTAGESETVGENEMVEVSVAVVEGEVLGDAVSDGETEVVGESEMESVVEGEGVKDGVLE